MESLSLTESTYYILLCLHEPQHGYGIMQETAYLSKGRVKLAAGTLYGALVAMIEKGWIIQLPYGDNERKKEYKLTAQGIAVLRNEIRRLEELVENGHKILGGEL